MSPSNLVLIDPNSESLNYANSLPENLKITKFESALSRTGGSKILYKTNVLSGSSLLRPNVEFLNSDNCPPEIKNYFLPLKEIEIETISISSVLRDFHSTPMFLKIDVQGYELELLKGAKAFLEAGDIVLLEIESSLVRDPVMENASVFPEVFSFLSAFGYQIMDFNPVYEQIVTQKNQVKLGVLGECDATFIADSQEPKFQSPEKLIAIFVGYLVYGYPILAFRLLSENSVLREEVVRRGFSPEAVLQDLNSLDFGVFS
jgi:FkbM family methyltransferase